MKRYYKWIAWCLVLIYMGVILAFSSDPATVSGDKSSAILEIIKPLIIKITEISDGRTPNWSQMDHYIRKCAHMFNYFILSMLSLNAFRLSVTKRRKRMFIYSWLLCTGFSAVDEFYQTFIPGRSGQLSDMGVDNIGVIAGIAVFAAIGVIKKRKGHGMPDKL